MTYVAFLIPFVVGYIFYAWKQMSLTKITVEELNNDKSSY
jgi:TRAP-type mannitol/chloroaromatic compound transport system permease small subunit